MVMVKLFPIAGVVVSLTALFLLAIGSATNKWIILSRTDPTLNPVVTNSELSSNLPKAIGITSSTTDITYSVSHYGLWIGCHREHKGAVSCAYIGVKCWSDVCWIRKTTRSKSKTCKENRVRSIANCAAFQVTRGFVIVGLLVIVMGCAMQIVSLITLNRGLAMLAGVVVFVAGVLEMIAFAVFYGEQVRRVGDLGRIGYSLKLVSCSWVLMVVGGVMSCFAASLGLRHKEVSDYSASNY